MSGRIACTIVASFVLIVLRVLPVEASHRPEQAPKIVNWYYDWSLDTDEEAEELAEWDVLILDIENEYYSRDRMKMIKRLNPDITLLAYISPVDIRPDAASLDSGTARNYIGEQLQENPEWILKLASGEKARWWADFDIMNITSAGVNSEGETFNNYFSEFIRDAVVKDPIWDGVFYDNLWENVSFVSEHIDLDNSGEAESVSEMNTEWRKGITKLLKKTRRYAKKHRTAFLVTGNGGTRYYRHVNGIGFEHFPNTVYGEWTESMQQYRFILDNGQSRATAFVNANVNDSGDQADYQKFRFGLTSTLLENGYYSFDSGGRSHHERWYYDEYDVQLGEATSGAYNVLEPETPTQLQAGVWRRDYESATVLVNSTDEESRIDLNTGYEKIKGTQDTETNSGEVVGSVNIPAEDGIVLLPRLSTVRDTTFINGAFAKVFDGSGEEVRNSFFSYDGSFPGGTQVHKISQSGKTVVAGETFVRVYDNANRQIAEFAPYGSQYTGGVNIAVGALYGGEKTYIVTGTQAESPHVRIFDTQGNLVHAGCFPYAPEFRGGVNVGVGDLNGDDRMEIVVAAGFGGGPHIRILNNQCEVVNPGFFAFNEQLRIGVNMAVGDLNGDGNAEIIAASGPGGGPHVRVFNKNGTLLSAGFFAYAESDRSGVLVSTADIDQDGTDEIVTNSFSIFNEF